MYICMVVIVWGSLGDIKYPGLSAYIMVRTLGSIKNPGLCVYDSQ